MSRKSYDLVNQVPGEYEQLEGGVYRQSPRAPPPSYGEAIELGERQDGNSKGLRQGEQRPLLQRQASKLSQESLPFADDDGSLSCSPSDANMTVDSASAKEEDTEREQKVEEVQEKLRKTAQNTRESDGSKEEIEMMIMPEDRAGPTLRNRRPQRRSSLEKIEVLIGNERALEDYHDHSRETSFAAPPDVESRVQRTSLIIQPRERPVRDGISLESSEHDEPRIPDCPHPVLTYLVTKWFKLSPTKRLITVIVVVCILGLLLAAVLLPASFVYVNYYEYAISRNKWTNAEDFSTVYESGCYLIAPQYEMVRFTATAHHVEMNLAIMNKESMGIKLQIMLQYFLKRNEIVDLYRRYHLGYDSVIRNVVEATVKNTAIAFTMEDFRQKRNMVEAAILEKLQLALTGTCCPQCCPTKCSPSQSVVCSKCDLDPSTCSKGHHVELRYFQMGQVSIPEDVMNLYMRSSVLQIEWEREYFIQEKALVQKNTTLQVQRYLNKAEEILEAAKAQGYLIRATAEAERDRITQRSYLTALKRMFSELNLTREDDKLSFIYLRALDKSKENLLAFNYDVQSAVTP